MHGVQDLVDNCMIYDNGVCACVVVFKKRS